MELPYSPSGCYQTISQCKFQYAVSLTFWKFHVMPGQNHFDQIWMGYETDLQIGFLLKSQYLPAWLEFYHLSPKE